MKATGVRKPPIGQQAPAAQWRCKICKFANPTYIEEESKEASSLLAGTATKTLLKNCTKCRQAKQVMKEDPTLGFGSIRAQPTKPTLQAQRKDRTVKEAPQRGSSMQPAFG